jgi:hypothetical protein
MTSIEKTYADGHPRDWPDPLSSVRLDLRVGSAQVPNPLLAGAGARPLTP